MKINLLVKNISYSFGANLISLSTSVLMVVFVPKFLPVEDYGMWQLFLFYFSYLGFLHFGWEDGIYLRYAGKNFDELVPRIFAGQFYGIIILQIVLTIILILFSPLFIEESVKRYVFACAISLATFVNFNNCCNFIMQITNRIKEYAKFVLIDRVVLVTFILLALLTGHNFFESLYLAKLFAVICVSFMGIKLCKRLLVIKFESFNDILLEAYRNISVGIKLMFANIAGMLLIGIVRYGISIGWDIATFGKISLTLNISNFILVFITSLSVVFFPLLKRMKEDRLSELYKEIRNCLSILLLSMLVLYYPLKEIASWWLPQYADSLIYMAILFPICLFESKMSLLINTYLKSMRKESLLLKINMVSIVLAAVATIITVYFLHDLRWTVFSIVFLYAFRCEFAELYMERLLSINIKRDILQELLIVLVFIVSAIAIDTWWCVIIYLAVLLTYVCVNRDKLFVTVQHLVNRNLMD